VDEIFVSSAPLISAISDRQARTNLNPVQVASARKREPRPAGASSLFVDLQKQYRASGEAISVSFREMVGAIPIGDLSHSLYPYPARLLRQIPRFFLGVDQLVESCGLVVDPFCGSGTVLVEAQSAGLNSWGIDSNPFARLLSSVKTTFLEEGESSDACSSVLARAKRLRSVHPPDVVNIDLWYSQPAKSSLSRIHRAVMDSDWPPNMRNFLLICLALTADRCSLRDPRIPVPVRRKDWVLAAEAQSAATVWQTFETIGRAMSGALSKSPDTTVSTHVLGTDAAFAQRDFREHLAKLHGPPGLVITSPPYGAAQKYVRSSSLALGWTGLAKSEELAGLEHATIGREHLQMHERGEIQPPTKAIEAELRAIADADRGRAAIYARYFCEMDRVFAELGGILADGGHLVMIAGGNVVTGRVVNTHLHLRDLAVRHGLRQTLVLRDTIRGRVLLTSRANMSTPLHAETVFVFKKGD
jgi:hypothetical protein